jgi:RHS repeat-associated protein
LRHDSCFGYPFLFTGREWLSELKLYDYRNRLYQPELSRFMQPDPKQFEAGDYNLYRYCHNDPINNSDPFGLEFTGAGEATEVHDLRDPEGLVVNGLTGPYSVTALVAIVPGANGTFSLQVARFDVRVEDKRVAQTVNGNPRSRDQIDASKRHENLHEDHARADHDANQNKVLKTGLSSGQAKTQRSQEQRKLIQNFRMNREQDQRDCKKGEGVWKPIVREENKR